MDYDDRREPSDHLDSVSILEPPPLPDLSAYPSITTDPTKIRRFFGSDYKIGAVEDQPLSQIALFLRNAWGVMFETRVDPKNPNRIKIFIVPRPQKGSAPFLHPDFALRNILEYVKSVSPGVQENIIKSGRERFVVEQSTFLQSEFGSEGSVFFDAERPKAPFVIVGFPEFKDESKRNARARSINEAWEAELTRLKKQPSLTTPLEVSDLADIAPKRLTASLIERKKFSEAVSIFMGAHPPAPPPVVKFEPAPPNVSEALIYLPSLLDSEVLNDWQTASDDLDLLRENISIPPHWGDYINELSLLAGVDIAYVESHDFREAVLARVPFHQQRITSLEHELDLIRADTAQDAAVRARAETKTSRALGEERSELQLLLSPKGEAVRLAQPLDTIQNNGSREALQMPAIHIRLSANASTDADAAMRLQTAIQVMEWLVKKRNALVEKNRDAQTAYTREMNGFWGRHPAYSADGVENRQQKFDEDVAAFVAKQNSINGREDLSKTQKEAELKRLSKTDPRIDLPQLAKSTHISLSEISRQYKFILGSLRPSIPASTAISSPVQTKKPRAQSAAQAAKDEMTLRDHLPLPIPSQHILDVMLGDKRFVLGEFHKRFGPGFKIVVRPDPLRIMVPMNRKKESQVIEHNLHLKILRVLAELQRIAEISGRTLNTSELGALLNAPHAANGAEVTAATAAAEVTGSTTLVPLTSRLTTQHFANLIGPQEAILKLICDHFKGINLSVHDGMICITTTAMTTAEKDDRSARHRLHSIFSGLTVIAMTAPVTETNVTSAIRQSFDSYEEAVRDLFEVKIDILGLQDSTIIDRVMLDARPGNISYSPRERILFTANPGKSVLKRLTIKDGAILNRIKEKMGLSQIKFGDDTITLLGKQKKLQDGVDDGLGKIAETRNLILSLAHLIVEKQYTTLPEFEIALRHLMGEPGAVLPAAKVSEATKGSAKGVTVTSNGGIISTINGFEPEGNQIYADEILKDPRYSIAALVGPAGTGKTELALINAAQALAAGTYDQLIIATPMMTVGGKEIGFLPGTKEEKIARWFVRHKTGLIKILAPKGSAGEPDLVAGAKKVEDLIKKEKIQYDILEDMRGNNYERAVVIVDEAQNATPEQLLTALTRICENSKIWLTGDLKQADGRRPQGYDFKVPNTVSLREGYVDVISNGRVFTLGLEQDVGHFYTREDTHELWVRADSALGISVMLDSNAENFGLAVFDRSDIHRHPVISQLLALREAATKTGKHVGSGLNIKGSFDAARALADDAREIAERRGITPNKVLAFHPPRRG